MLLCTRRHTVGVDPTMYKYSIVYPASGGFFLAWLLACTCRVICVIIVIILPSWLALKRNVLHGGTHITRFLVLLLLIFALCLFVLPA